MRWLAAITALGIAGCQTAALWTPTSRRHVEGQPVLAVQVAPVTLGTDQTAPLTHDELTELLLHHLEEQGIEATFMANPDQAQGEILSCTVPRVTHIVTKKFPRQITYEAELACSLVSLPTQAVSWQRTLSQKYEKTVLLNTMTLLPPQHDRLLFEECIIPLWYAMAYSVRLYLEQPKLERQPATAGELPAAPAPPAEEWSK